MTRHQKGIEYPGERNVTFTPQICYVRKKISSKNLGTRSTFVDIGATILDYFDIAPQISGSSMLKEL